MTKQASVEAHPGFQVLLAAIPLLFVSLHLQEAVYYALAAAVTIWGTVIAFRFGGFLFPERLRSAAWILWLAALSQSTVYLFGFSPLWIIGPAFLTWQIVINDTEKEYSVKVNLLQGGGLAAVVIIMAVFRYWLGVRALIPTFQGPIGGFLVLAGIAWISQIGARRVRRS